MNLFRIPLRIVFYREDDEWVAHCLEFDLCGDGATKEKAVEFLIESIRLQIEYTLENSNPRNLFSPAPSEIQEKFFAGKNIAVGEIKMHLQNDRMIVEESEYREYSEDFSTSDAGCVPA